jgi:DNA-directed RNA polymerase specialized sigma24 family protein
MTILAEVLRMLQAVIRGTRVDRVAQSIAQEDTELAFLALVQLLPARQRAELILHDVVGFSAGRAGVR